MHCYNRTVQYIYCLLLIAEQSKLFACSLPLWRVHEIKHMYLAPRTHGLFITYTVNQALLASSFVWQIQLYFHHISLFKIIKRKYFIQSKCEFMKLLFVVFDKIKIFPLYTVYLPHQLLHMLFFTPFRNF